MLCYIRPLFFLCFFLQNEGGCVHCCNSFWRICSLLYLHLQCGEVARVSAEGGHGHVYVNLYSDGYSHSMYNLCNLPLLCVLFSDSCFGFSALGITGKREERNEESIVVLSVDLYFLLRRIFFPLLLPSQGFRPRRKWYEL